MRPGVGELTRRARLAPLVHHAVRRRGDSSRAGTRFLHGLVVIPGSLLPVVAKIDFFLVTVSASSRSGSLGLLRVRLDHGPRVLGEMVGQVVEGAGGREFLADLGHGRIDRVTA